MARRQRVMVVDDDRDILRWVSVLLGKLDVEVEAIDNPTEALARAVQSPPDLVLLDVHMPGVSGYDVCESLQAKAETRDVPVIFLTGGDSNAEKVRAFALGAFDYVTKPFDTAELLARVRAVLRLQALVERLEVQANTDALTGLPNRGRFRTLLTRTLARAADDKDYRFAVLFLDLDRFKVINDSLGHEFGDQLLIRVAEKLQATVDEVRGVAPGRKDVVARMGGDEFTILLDGADEAAAVSVAQRLVDVMNRPSRIESYHVNHAVSVGVRLGDGTDTVDILLRDADTALYQAKGAGKARYVLFDQVMHEEALNKLRIEHDLQRAVDARQFELFYQPVVGCLTGELRSFEALIRWRHPSRGLLAPAEFIGVAEETGHILPLGYWVIEEVCRQLQAWQAQRPGVELPLVSVNLSRRQLAIPGFVERVFSIVDTADIEPKRIEFEVTESAMVEDNDIVQPSLERLQQAGFSIAMDDFGTGQSSLASLHQLPLKVVKIAREFIARTTQSRSYAAIVASIIQLADNLDVEVVAEGVESFEQLVQLQALDCHYAQGYYFARPVNAAEAMQMLDRTGWCFENQTGQPAA